jgi:hypothetical protein
MSCVILCQIGSKCFDPSSQNYYDPWTSHIWDVVNQIRKWDNDIPVYFIVDESIENIPNYENFNLLKITPIETKDLDLEVDLQDLNYFQSHHDPLWKTSFYRFFYINSLIKIKKLENCITFDNDVLIYNNLTELSNKLNTLYKNSCITPVMSNELVCGFFWIKNSNVLSQINKGLIHYAKNPFDHHPTEMKILYMIQQSVPDLIENLPIWPDGNNSKHVDLIQGIFDPCTISQFLAGCNNGQPPGTILMHHLLGSELQKQTYTIQEITIDNKKTFYLINKDGVMTRINNLHMHKKSVIKNYI